jgi:Leucine-rich repeat (LRR) protein
VEGILRLGGNGELTALPAGLCSLAGLEALDLSNCGLTALPAGLGRLRNLKMLDLYSCPGWQPSGTC